MLAATMACATIASAAHAEPSAADRATARALGTEGEAALAQKDFAKAADRYARAEALFHAPTLLLGLARAQAGLGRLIEARETYRRLANDTIAANAPPQFQEAVRAADAEGTALEKRIAFVTITVTGGSATVTLDGERLSAAAIGVRRAVDPGHHEIVATGPNGRAKAAIDVKEGASQPVPLAIRADPSPPPVEVGTPPLDRPPVEPSTSSSSSSSSSSSLRRTLGFVGIGLGGGGLIVGAATGAYVLNHHGSLVKDCPGGRCPASSLGAMNTYDAMGAASTAGFILGGALAATGIVLVATAPKEPSASSTATLVAWPGGAGIRGTW